ncbi:hypothetical protein EC988_001961 [Linderina pennispora]|nr:hypothetical protein EC988_001961 [Linderina pennispora]
MSIQMALLVIVGAIALYYLCRECWKLVSKRSRANSRVNARANAARDRIRSMVKSYAEGSRSSDYYPNDEYVEDEKTTIIARGIRPSAEASRPGSSVNPLGSIANPIDKILQSADGSSKHPSDLVSSSDGATTTVTGSNSRPSVTFRRLRTDRETLSAASNNMRHTRVIDDSDSNEPYLSRRLTISERGPMFRARRGTGVQSNAGGIIEEEENEVDSDQEYAQIEAELAGDGPSNAIQLEDVALDLPMARPDSTTVTGAEGTRLSVVNENSFTIANQN